LLKLPEIGMNNPNKRVSGRPSNDSVVLGGRESLGPAAQYYYGHHSKTED